MDCKPPGEVGEGLQLPGPWRSGAVPGGRAFHNHPSTASRVPSCACRPLLRAPACPRLRATRHVDGRGPRVRGRISLLWSPPSPGHLEKRSSCLCPRNFSQTWHDPAAAVAAGFQSSCADLGVEQHGSHQPDPHGSCAPQAHPGHLGHCPHHPGHHCHHDLLVAVPGHRSHHLSHAIPSHLEWGRLRTSWEGQVRDEDSVLTPSIFPFPRKAAGGTLQRGLWSSTCEET